MFLTNCESLPPLFSENPEAILDSIGGDGVYKCDPCNFETKYSGNLKEHFKTQKHLTNTNTSTHDEDPNFEFNESKVNISEEIHRCEPCNFESKWIQSLQAHYKSSKHISNTDPSNNEGIYHDKSNGNWDHPYITSSCVWPFLVQPTHFISRSEHFSIPTHMTSDFLQTHPPDFFCQ